MNVCRKISFGRAITGNACVAVRARAGAFRRTGLLGGCAATSRGQRLAVPADSGLSPASAWRTPILRVLAHGTFRRDGRAIPGPDAGHGRHEPSTGLANAPDTGPGSGAREYRRPDPRRGRAQSVPYGMPRRSCRPFAWLRRLGRTGRKHCRMMNRTGGARHDTRRRGSEPVDDAAAPTASWRWSSSEDARSGRADLDRALRRCPRRLSRGELGARGVRARGMETRTVIARLMDIFEGPDSMEPWTPPPCPEAAARAAAVAGLGRAGSELYINESRATASSLELPPFAGIDAETLGALAGVLADAAPAALARSRSFTGRARGSARRLRPGPLPGGKRAGFTKRLRSGGNNCSATPVGVHCIRGVRRSRARITASSSRCVWRASRDLPRKPHWGVSGARSRARSPRPGPTRAAWRRTNCCRSPPNGSPPGWGRRETPRRRRFGPRGAGRPGIRSTCNAPRPDGRSR